MVADLPLQEIMKEGEWIQKCLCSSEVSWGSSHGGTLNYLGHLGRTIAKGIPRLRSIFI